MTQPISATRTGLVLALVGIAAAIVATVTSFVLTTRLYNEDALRSDMNTILTSVSEEIVANTDAYLLPAAQTADFVSDFVEAGAVGAGDTAGDELLLSVLRANESLDGIYVGGVDGTFLYARQVGERGEGYEVKRIWFDEGQRFVEVETFNPELQPIRILADPTDAYDPRGRTWFIDAADMGADVWTDPYIFFSSGDPGVTRSSPVYRNGELAQVVGVDIRINQLSGFIAERSPSPNGASFLMTNEQLLVAYPGLNTMSDGSLPYVDDLSDPALQLAGDALEAGTSSETGAVISEADGEQLQFVMTPLEANPEWVAVTYSPTDDFLSAVRSTSRTNMMISLGLGVVILAALLPAAAWVGARLRKNEGLLEASEAASDRAELELAKTNEQLQASNRELEQYAYAAAHDLRTPLRAIGGYGELISQEVENDAPDPDLLRRWADQIMMGYERMGQTMDNLLDHARLSRLGPADEAFTTVDANKVATTVLGDLARTMEEADARADVSDLPHVWADETQLGRVFQNLLENAIRFRSPDRPLRVNIDGSQEGAWVKFRVRDNGTGIHGANKSRIFDSFTKAGDSSGVGLGLALVKRMVEDHGGVINVESADGDGTTFEFSMPAANERIDA